MGLFIPFLIALAAGGVSGCLASPFGKKEEPENTPEPCPPSSDLHSSEDGYDAYFFSGPVWPGASAESLSVYLEKGISSKTASYINEQTRNCGFQSIQKMGLSGPFTPPRIFVGSFSKDSNAFRGVITLPRELYHSPPSDWLPGDPRCLDPIIDHELNHHLNRDGILVALKKHSPENRILEEGLADKVSRDVAQGQSIATLAEQPLNPLSVDPALHTFRLQTGNSLQIAFSSAQLTDDTGNVTKVYVHPGPVQSTQGFGFTVERNGQKIDDCRSTYSTNLYELGIKTFCFLHDRGPDQTVLETGSLFLVEEDLSDYFRDGLNTSTACLPEGFQEIQSVNLGSGRVLRLTESSVTPYGVSLNAVGDYLDPKSYATGACFWNFIEQTYGTPAFQEVIRTLKNARPKTVDNELDLIDLMAKSLNISASEMEQIFLKFNIPFEFFRDQIVGPICR